ncbi:MAG: hypothetical protein BMS9Abin13_416 [Patescibacteria group bacterium]|nr:MAG: hypothetical protein BMS9Abin13_416 [Patescibacteria group bacterium]
MDNKKTFQVSFGQKKLSISIEAVVGIAILVFMIWAVFGSKISCSFQGGEIREYKPVYEVVSTGQTFGGDIVEYACFKETPTGYKKLFNIK